MPNKPTEYTIQKLENWSSDQAVEPHILRRGVMGKSADGSYYNLNVDSDGNTIAKDFYLEVSKGNIPGHSIMSKFGQNDSLQSSTYEDVWDEGGVYTYPADASADITHIYSTVGGDDQDTEVQGLSSDGTLTVQTLALTGTTVAQLATPLWRVFRMRNVDTTDNAGIVYASDADKTPTYARMSIGNNQTLMALYTIPLGKTGYMMLGTNSLIGTVRAYTVAGRMEMRPFGGVFQLKKTFGLSSDGTSYMTMPWPLPGKIGALTDIKVSAISSATGGINTTFEILLVDD